ncbi:hypothetical protein WICMUC_000025 [Wickerhamomyces mucosus]|uniref:TauD/TfdA-like domain-containing protein n=1 Tax=Wickerhamomyces mucosus TaxID=1378264 RepID=A0A9P8PYH3_9ASCO|nr:hypothetical protein WICMUC_000025 [Wickerhamomyces mucosus]
MAPTAETITETVDKIAELKLSNSKLDSNPTTIEVELKNSFNIKPGYASQYSDQLPEQTKKRFAKHGIDISKGYPKNPDTFPYFLDEGIKATSRSPGWEEFQERGKFADKSKKNLFAKATEVKDLSKYIGTELVGVKLSELNEVELDELSLLISERVVVFFRNQDLSPQDQIRIGGYLGHEIEKHPLGAHVPLPGIEGPTGITTIWGKYYRKERPQAGGFRKRGGRGWHQDLVHLDGNGYAHLHLDAIPATGGDTAFASLYGAYDKLSPAFQKFIEGLTVVQRSAHSYYDRADPLSGPKYIEKEYPLVFTHPVTGWKSLYLNRIFTVRIKELEPEESDIVLKHLFTIIETNLDIQARVNWANTSQDRSLGASVFWDNRIANHYAIDDYDDDEDPRHGTRVVSLVSKLYLDPESKSQRESLGLAS